MNPTLSFYEENTSALVEQYDSVPFETVHQDWLKHLPKHGSVLDIGAGSGRDARYFADKGLTVYAAEPVSALVNSAQIKSKEHSIVWLQDSLPSLDNIKSHNKSFDLILLSAVWMHLSPNERILSMQNMSKLLLEDGKLVITLRCGEFSDGRMAYPVCANEVRLLAQNNGLNTLLSTNLKKDQLGRGHVEWQTLVLQKLNKPSLHL